MSAVLVAILAATVCGAAWLGLMWLTLRQS